MVCFRGMDKAPKADHDGRSSEVTAVAGVTVGQAMEFGGSLLGLVSFAYLVGWIRTWNYCESFGAAWLCFQIPHREIMTSAALPVAFFLIGFLTTLVDVARNRSHHGRVYDVALILVFVGLAISVGSNLVRNDTLRLAWISTARDWANSA